MVASLANKIAASMQRKCHSFYGVPVLAKGDQFAMLQASAAPEEDAKEEDAAGKALEEEAEREAVATLRKSQEAAKDRESGEEVSSSRVFSILHLCSWLQSSRCLISYREFD